MGVPAPMDYYVGIYYLDVFSPGVSWSAPVSVARRGLIVACRDTPINCFLSYCWGLAILKKFDTEMRVFHTQFCIDQFILKPPG